MRLLSLFPQRESLRTADGGMWKTGTASTRINKARPSVDRAVNKAPALNLLVLSQAHILQLPIKHSSGH